MNSKATSNKYVNDFTLELKNYLNSLDFGLVDYDLLEDIKSYFKSKKKTASLNLVELASKETEDVSHEAQVSFLIKHGIKIGENINDLQSEYILDNYVRVEFYGIEYYLRVKDHKDVQNIFNYFIENNRVEVVTSA